MNFHPNNNNFIIKFWSKAVKASRGYQFTWSVEERESEGSGGGERGVTIIISYHFTTHSYYIILVDGCSVNFTQLMNPTSIHVSYNLL